MALASLDHNPREDDGCYRAAMVLLKMTSEPRYISCYAAAFAPAPFRR
jgi:hypothetical protein